MSEWIHTELKNLTTKIGSGATPRGGQEAYKTEGISLIRSQNILDFSFSTNGLAFIDDEQARQLQNVEIKEKDVLINITGDSVARVCMVPSKTLPARVNQHVAILRADTKKLDPDYLLYYLLNPVIKRHLLRLSSDGATRNALTTANLAELIISAPKDINQQREISEKIKLFDSKITLLRQQNQTLEELAQTLFKRWFLDFEFPNENGQPYKSSGGKMIESELGEIPKGWRIGALSSLFDFLEGPGIRNWQYSETGIPFINIRLIKDEDIEVKSANFVTTEEGNGKYSHFKLQEKDMVVSTSGSLGKTAIVRKSHLPLLLNTSVIRFRPLPTSNYPFMYQYLKSKSFETELLTLASGSVQLNFGPTHLKQIEMIIPNQEILYNFKLSCDHTYDKIIQNQEEIQSLTQLRDTLLPKLMSREIEIKV